MQSAQTAIGRHPYNQTPSDNETHLSSTLKRADHSIQDRSFHPIEKNSILYLCALCLCMKAQSLRGAPSSCISTVLCGVWFKDWFSKWRHWCIFHLAQWPASANIQFFRGIVLKIKTFLETGKLWWRLVLAKTSYFELWRQLSLCSAVAALEVCAHWRKRREKQNYPCEILLIVPYPLHLTFPSCPGANTGATPWSSPGMKIKQRILLFHCPLPHVVFPLAAASSGSHCFLSWTLDTLRVEYSIWFLPPSICYLVCEGFSTNAAVYFCALNNGTQTERRKPWYQNWEWWCVHSDQTFCRVWFWFCFSSYYVPAALNQKIRTVAMCLVGADTVSLAHSESTRTSYLFSLLRSCRKQKLLTVKATAVVFLTATVLLLSRKHFFSFQTNQNLHLEWELLSWPFPQFCSKASVLLV